MFGSFCRLRRCQCVRLATTLLVLSLVMLCWERLDDAAAAAASHARSQSYRHPVNRFAVINRSLTVPRQQARRFSSFRYLLDHPDKCAGEDVLLLLFVKTSPENAERRTAIRSTWGNETFIRAELGASVKVLFVLGAPPTADDETSWHRRGGASSKARLVQEDRLHGDLIQQDFLDSFHNLTLKLILQFHWMRHRCAHAHFLMTADDDVFVHTPNLVRYLLDSRSRSVTDLWVGRVHRGAPPIRSRDSKYYVPFEMYPWASYPDYTAGAGYVVSGDVADKIYQATLTLNASLYIDDVFMGICANAVGVSPQEHVYFSGEGRAPYHACIYERMMTSHGHVEDIHDLWAAATSPQVRQRTSGLMGALYCTAVKMALLCRPYYSDTYPCRAACL